MPRVQVTQELQNSVQKAMVNPFRFERYERFAMREVLKAWEAHGAAEKVFVDTAHSALGLPRRPELLTAVNPAPRISAAA